MDRKLELSILIGEYLETEKENKITIDRNVEKIKNLTSENEILTDTNLELALKREALEDELSDLEDADENNE